MKPTTNTRVQLGCHRADVQQNVPCVLSDVAGGRLAYDPSNLVTIPEGLSTRVLTLDRLIAKVYGDLQRTDDPRHIGHRTI